jgi:hypothetical protein
MGDGDSPMTLYGTADWKAVIRDHITVTVIPAGYTPEAAFPKLRRPTPMPPCSCDFLLAVAFLSNRLTNALTSRLWRIDGVAVSDGRDTRPIEFPYVHKYQLAT